MGDLMTCTAFAGDCRVAAGDVRTMLRQLVAHLGGEPLAPVLIFDDRNGRQIDFDLRGGIDEVLARLPQHPLLAAAAEATAARRGPGRPRLGVVSREVSLLPRHWEWLEQQPSGISAALRRLVEQATREQAGDDRARLASEAASRFMTAMAGDRPGYEAASRALFAGDLERLEALVGAWPADIREYALRLARGASAGDACPG